MAAREGDAPASLGLQVQCTLGACAFTKRHTKQVPKSSLGQDSISQPATGLMVILKSGDPRKEQDLPCPHTRVDGLRSPEIPQPPWSPNTSFGCSSRAWTSLTLPSWALPGPCPSLCQG